MPIKAFNDPRPPTAYMLTFTPEQAASQRLIAQALYLYHRIGELQRNSFDPKALQPLRMKAWQRWHRRFQRFPPNQKQF